MHSEPYDPAAGAVRRKGRGQRGTLKTLSSGRTQASYRVNGRNGPRPKKTFDLREDAAKWLRDRLDEVDAVQGGDLSSTRSRAASLTVEEMIDDYLAAHEADWVTIRHLRSRLNHSKRRFGNRLAASVSPYEWQAFRKTLSPGAAFDAFAAIRQVYRAAVKWDWLPENPTAEVPNPETRRGEVQIPPWESVVLIADEIDERYSALPIFLAATGLRIEELFGLRREDVDLKGRVVKVRQAYSSCKLSELGDKGKKTWRQRRNVPLRQVAVDAVRAVPTRIDSPVFFPAPEGGYFSGTNFLNHYWKPAVDAAGVDYFPPKNLRHLYASEALASGSMSLLALSKRMGTSLRMIDQTYGHLVHDADERELAILDAYDAARPEPKRRAAEA
jgi:integrase